MTKCFFLRSLEILSVISISMHYEYRCGPCEVLNPKFEKLPKKYPTAVFIQVDVGKCYDTVAELEISVIPTFILYRNKVNLFAVQKITI